MNGPMPPSGIDDIRRLLRVVLRSDLTAFVERCFNQVNPGIAFVPEWYIDAIAHQLERVRRGEIKRLIVNLPPRSLKSIMASVAFPAFVLGHDPSKRILCVSYSSDLAADFTNQFRSVVTQPWYQDVFPALRIDPRKNTETETVTTQRGFRLSTSTGGTLTGRGADIIIIDDPIKAEDAMSETMRERLNQWFTNTLVSRLNDKATGAIVVVMQRVHMNDLTGFLRERSEGWEVLSLSAIADVETEYQLPRGSTYLRQAGEALSIREPLPVLERLQGEIGSAAFATQYLQEPAPPGGAMVRREWIQRDDIPPDPDDGMTYLSWDTAMKGGPDNSYSVCVVLQRVARDRFYVLDVVRRKMQFPALLECVATTADRYSTPTVLIEDKGSGISLLQSLKGRVAMLHAIKPEGDKEARLAKVTALMERGELFLPVQAPWLADFERELFSFPGSQFDDQVDALSQALNFCLGDRVWAWTKLFD